MIENVLTYNLKPVFIFDFTDSVYFILLPVHSSMQKGCYIPFH